MNKEPKAVVEIWLARCPKCGSADLQHRGTRKNPRGETLRYYECREVGCRTKFRGRVMNPDDD